LAIYVANWPRRRADAWQSLLKARAAENQAYVIGVNRVGVDGTGVSYSGDSMIVDPVGNVLEHLSQKEATITVSLSMEKLNDFRQKFPVWKDADRFTIDEE